MVRQSLEATWGSYYTVQKRVDSDLHWASLERAGRERFASDLGAGVARPGRPIGWFLLLAQAPPGSKSFVSATSPLTEGARWSSVYAALALKQLFCPRLAGP